MTDIHKELAEATVISGARPGIVSYLSPQLHAKVLRFAVEHGLAEESLVEGKALAVIAARYFRILEEDWRASWLPEQVR